MATMNGILSPPPNSELATASINLLAKRKREDSVDAQNATKSTLDIQSGASTALSAEESKDLVKLLIEVLKGHDTTPSILSRSIPVVPASTGPQAKRQKSVNEAEDQTSILARLSSDSYTNLDEVLDDINTAVSDIIHKVAVPNATNGNQYIPASSSQLDTLLKVKVFKQRAQELVRRERASVEARSGSMDPSRASAHNLKNGSGSNYFTRVKSGSDENRMVLTLYGNAPGPKQLFSSLQKPTNILGDSMDILQPIRETGLPNGITTTQVVPIQSTGLVDDKKRVPTLGELFPTPSTVPALVPPKPSKLATTRSSTVGWYQPSSAEHLPRTATYFRQSISSGQWLDYSTTTTLQNSKKKQRERALSLVGSKAPAVEVDADESEAAKLDALFKSAYSSFAPSRDDSAAIVPTRIMDRIWWQEVGEQKFERMVESASKLDLPEGDDTDMPCKDNGHPLTIVEEDLQDLEKDAIDPSLVSVADHSEKSVEEKDAEEILEGISELLETLNSYQRNRHLSLNPINRPASLLSGPDAATQGTPTKPSEAEQATYEILKSQLTLMVASLPPFAVAKLDPNRLSELSISTKIEVQTNNQRGVMEEDESATRAKIAAMGTASTSRPAPPATASRSSSSSALYGNQYASTQRPSAPSHQQYYTSAQTPNRPPSNNIQRAPSTAPVPYATQRTQAGVNPYRPSSYGTPGPQYPHQTPRPAQTAYTPSAQASPYASTSTNQQYLRAPTHAYPQQAQSMAATPNGRYPGTHSAYTHQSQPSHESSGYQYGNGGQVPPANSSQKPIYNAQPVSGARPIHSTSTTAGTVDARPYMQNAMAQVVNGSGVRAPQMQYSGLTGFRTHLDTEQQQTIMEKQRAQLASQKGVQSPAMNVAHSALGSPSKSPSYPIDQVATGGL